MKTGPFRGTIKPDPAVSATSTELGDLKFQAHRSKLHLGLGAGALPQLDFYGGTLLYVHFAERGAHSIDGSAVLVAPGIALCATHVFQDLLEKLKAGRTSAICVSATQGGMQIWRVASVAQIPRTDLTLLGLTYASDIPDDKTFSQAAITTRLPVVGERVTLAGFRSKRVSASDGGDVASDGNVLVSVAEVTQVYPHGRDRFMMYWPVIEVNGPAWGGMSGGPVFDADGFLIGIVCSSFTTRDERDGPAYVSLLLPALTYQFEAGWPRPSHASLLDLAQTGACDVDRADAISKVKGDNGEDSWRYVPW